MATFEIYSKGCSHCKDVVSAIQSAVEQKGCGCDVKEVSCDGACDVAKQHSFSSGSLPVILRDGAVVRHGELTEEQALSLLPSS